MQSPDGSLWPDFFWLLSTFGLSLFLALYYRGTDPGPEPRWRYPDLQGSLISV